MKITGGIEIGVVDKNDTSIHFGDKVKTPSGKQGVVLYGKHCLRIYGGIYRNTVIFGPYIRLDNDLNITIDDEKLDWCEVIETYKNS